MSDAMIKLRERLEHHHGHGRGGHHGGGHGGGFASPFPPPPHFPDDLGTRIRRPVDFVRHPHFPSVTCAYCKTIFNNPERDMNYCSNCGMELKE